MKNKKKGLGVVADAMRRTGLNPNEAPTNKAELAAIPAKRFEEDAFQPFQWACEKCGKQCFAKGFYVVRIRTGPRTGANLSVCDECYSSFD